MESFDRLRKISTIRCGQVCCGLAWRPDDADQRFIPKSLMQYNYLKVDPVTRFYRETSASGLLFLYIEIEPGRIIIRRLKVRGKFGLGIYGMR